MGKRTSLGVMALLLAIGLCAGEARADGVDTTYQYTSATVRAHGTPITHSFSWSDPPTNLTPPWWMGSASHWYDSYAYTYSTIQADRIYHSSTMTTDPSAGSYALSSTYVRFVADGHHDYEVDGLFFLSQPGAYCIWYVWLIDETTGQTLYYASRGFQPATAFYNELGDGAYVLGSPTGRLIDGHQYRFQFFARTTTAPVGANSASTAWASLDLESVPPEQLLSELIDELEDLVEDGGLEESLSAKIGNALDALEDTNTANDGSAVNRVNAFKSQVEAQRGHMLTDAEATQLIGMANDILELLLE